jgi:hypothetical protein
VNDDGVVARTLFDFENSFDCVGLECVCGESVNGFGGQSNDFSLPEEVSGLQDRGTEESGRVG